MPRLARIAPAEPRRATHVTLPAPLPQEARVPGINLSQAGERGLAAEVAPLRRERWRAGHRQALDAWNAHIAAHGLPLAAYRQF